MFYPEYLQYFIEICFYIQQDVMYFYTFSVWNCMSTFLFKIDSSVDIQFWMVIYQVYAMRGSVDAIFKYPIFHKKSSS